MFRGLINDAKSAVGNLILKYLARASVAVLRAQGHGLSETARRLNAASVPTPSGLIGRWLPATVLRVEHPDRANAYMREWRRRQR